MRLIKKMKESLAFKTILSVVFLLALYAIAISAIGYMEVSKALLDQYADGAYRTAGIVLRFVDADKIQEFIDSEGKSEEYKTTLDRLNQACNASGSMFIYVIVPDETDYKHIKFVFSAMNQESTFTHYEFGYVRETSNEDYENAYRRLCEEHSAREVVVRDRGYIETNAHITAMLPIMDSTGDVHAILCVQRQMEELIEARNGYLSKILLAMIFLLVIVIVVLSLRISQLILKPILRISDEAARYARESVVPQKKLGDYIHTRDEIGQLAVSIDKMEEQIHEYVQHLTQITAEKERISTEMSLAARIQSDMLPNVFPAFPDRHDFDIYASMTPAREIGGDFYHFFLIDDDHLCLIIADVSGKGVPAALFMMASIITLVNVAKMGEKPSEILRIANEAICATNREEMFVTIWLGILDLKSGKMIASNAGHEFPAICQPNGQFELFKDPHGFVIGGMEGSKYKDYELDMKPGSKIFVYTDGIPEASDENDNMFGTERMIEALNKDAGAGPQELLGNVRESVREFVNGAEQFDDMTMLCMEYKGK